MTKRVLIVMVNGRYEEVGESILETKEVKMFWEYKEKEEVAKNAFRYGDILTDDRTEENGVHKRITVIELEN